MSVLVRIVDGPLPRGDAPPPIPHAGAVIVFEGIVRAAEGDRTITALAYEAYEPMASRELHRLAAEALATFGILAIHVLHSRGTVRVGEVSFRLEIAGKHRKESIAAMDWFIDAMKRDVPLWKTPVWST